MINYTFSLLILFDQPQKISFSIIPVRLALVDYTGELDSNIDL